MAAWFFVNLRLFLSIRARKPAKVVWDSLGSRPHVLPFALNWDELPTLANSLRPQEFGFEDLKPKPKLCTSGVLRLTITPIILSRSGKHNGTKCLGRSIGSQNLNIKSNEVMLEGATVAQGAWIGACGTHFVSF